MEIIDGPLFPFAQFMEGPTSKEKPGTEGITVLISQVTEIAEVAFL